MCAGGGARRGPAERGNQSTPNHRARGRLQRARSGHGRVRSPVKRGCTRGGGVSRIFGQPGYLVLSSGGQLGCGILPSYQQKD